MCSGSCSGPNLLLFSACWQRLRRRRTMGKKSLIYSGSISGIFLIYYRKCFDRELGFSGPNLLLFSVFWQRPCCWRTTESKKPLIFLGFGKSFCLFVLSGVKAAVNSGSCRGPDLLLFSAYRQWPLRWWTMCQKSLIYFGLQQPCRWHITGKMFLICFCFGYQKIWDFLVLSGVGHSGPNLLHF